MLDPSDNSYSAANLSSLQTPSSTTYGLSGGVDPDGCAVDLPGLMSAGEAMVVSDPPMDMPACSSTGELWCYFLDPHPSEPHGVTLSWEQSSDTVVVQLDWIDYYSVGGGLTASLVCHLPDTGGVTLGSNDMIGMPAGLYQIMVMRYRTSSQIHPRSGGTVYGTYLDAQIGYGWVFQELGDQFLGTGCWSGC